MIAHSNSKKAKKFHALFFFLIATALAGATRLGVLLFWGDNHAGYEELRQGMLALHLLDGLLAPIGDYMYGYYAGGTVVTGISAAPFFKLIGPTVLALRLPSVIFAAIGIGCFALAFRLSMGRLAGWLAAAALCFFPPYPMKMSVTAFGNHAELASLLGIWALTFVWALKNRKNPQKIGALFFLGSVTGFLCFFDMLAFFFIPAGLLIAILSSPRKRLLLKNVSFGAGFLLGIFPRYFVAPEHNYLGMLIHMAKRPPGAENMSRGFSRNTWDVFSEQTIHASSGLAESHWTWLLNFILISSVILGFFLIRKLVRTRGKNPATSAEWFGILLILACWSFPIILFLLRPDSPPRYMLPWYPVLLTIPVLFVSRFWWLFPLALIAPLLCFTEITGQISKHPSTELALDGYGYHYFNYKFGEQPLSERLWIVERSLQDANECEKEFSMRLLTTATAFTEGADIRGHVRRLAGEGAAGRRAEDDVWRALKNFNFYLDTKLENQEEITDFREFLIPFLQRAPGAAFGYDACTSAYLGLPGCSK